jgi:uncharacterized membrane protein
MNHRPLIAAGTLMGMGMGGFLDGILFHQVLQIHNMLSATIPPTTVVNIETNMVWDGLFHAGTWVMTAIAIALLWHAGKQRDVPWSGRTLVGSAVMGWGLFNLVEGIIDHYILGVHHVVERLGLSMYDSAFLASGLLFISIGMRLIRSGARDTLSGHPARAHR